MLLRAYTPIGRVLAAAVARAAARVIEPHKIESGFLPAEHQRSAISDQRLVAGDPLSSVDPHKGLLPLPHCNCSKCRLRRAGKGTLAPGPPPARNPDPTCAPTPTGTPAPARVTPAPAPTPAGTPTPPTAAPAAAAVPAPTAMPARSGAPGMSGAEIGRGGKGGEGDDNHHQEFTCHRTLLSRPPIGAGPAEV